MIEAREEHMRGGGEFIEDGVGDQLSGGEDGGGGGLYRMLYKNATSL